MTNRPTLRESIEGIYRALTVNSEDSLYSDEAKEIYGVLAESLDAVLRQSAPDSPSPTPVPAGCPECGCADDLATVERSLAISRFSLVLTDDNDGEVWDMEWDGDTDTYDGSETIGIICRNCDWMYEPEEEIVMSEEDVVAQLTGKAVN